MSSKLLLGYDIGSSSVKASVIDAETGIMVASAGSPETEMKIDAPKMGWAEQNPELWWKHLSIATKKIIDSNKIDPKNIEAIGISYQMHGLVVVDKDQKVLHPSIIWCDSRAVEIGNNAFNEMGAEFCLENYLNSPGNFTASKLKWVKENKPEVFEQIYKFMLPGDYIAMKLTGEICTTVSGLSEGVLWDFKKNTTANDLLNHYGLSNNLIPKIVPTFGDQGTLLQSTADELGLKAGIKIAYRAGDQPNNAFSLNVLNPGEVATTAGTSGVVYGVTELDNYDSESRVNSFAHVNYSDEKRNKGVLLCINGTGILNSWIRNEMLNGGISYNDMNKIASEAPIGSENLITLPFGNGAERSLSNKEVQANIFGLNFNRHSKAHMLRSAQEGIVFAFKYGMEIMEAMGLKMDIVRAGKANMFLSPLFREAFVNTSEATLELYNTDGSEGAARGAGIGAGIYNSADEAFDGLKKLEHEEPVSEKVEQYAEAYLAWKEKLNFLL
ncbi:MAG: carbohydrate kinase [Melioribacteraceae bacterium]|nr:carbohydrate kinase [Melioribacteraceae bacterium]